MLEYLFGAVAVLEAVIIAILIQRMGRRTFPNATAPASSSTDAQAATPAASEKKKAEEVQRIEQSKQVIHALLRNISDNVENLTSDATRYDDSLARHKSQLGRNMTVAGIRELERVMIAEIEDMQKTNGDYRKQLEQANATVHAQQEELARLQADAGTDSLTRLPNRRSWDTRITEELNRAKRYGNIFSIIIFDIDHFKSINDIYGHVAGDRMLAAVGGLIAEQKRATDFVARYGGEEFVILLPETPADKALVMAENIGKKIAAAKFRFEQRFLRLTISAGVGEVIPGKDTAESIFKRVDAALYTAKKAGRNCVRIATVFPGQEE